MVVFTGKGLWKASKNMSAVVVTGASSVKLRTGRKQGSSWSTLDSAITPQHLCWGVSREIIGSFTEEIG
jgi:hypothetical protein